MLVLPHMSRRVCMGGKECKHHSYRVFFSTAGNPVRCIWRRIFMHAIWNFHAYNLKGAVHVVYCLCCVGTDNPSALGVTLRTISIREFTRVTADTATRPQDAGQNRAEPKRVYSQLARH
jgi:hypothetical protein